MRSVLIIFPDEHLPYSPTILNLAKALQKNFRVEIISFSSKHFGVVNEPFVTYLFISFIQKKVYGLINKFSKYFGLKVLASLKKIAVQQHLQIHHYDDVIVTDPIALWMVKGIPGLNLHMVSLELTHNTTAYLHKINMHTLRSLVIQSPERKTALSDDYKGPVFYLQNAPDYNPALESKALPETNNFIFSGTAFAWFGIFHCLNFLKQYPETRMTLIGKVPDNVRVEIHEKYAVLMANNQLDIPAKYFEADDMLNAIAVHRIGFCFYDLSYEKINNINYLTAPSGKMFAYFAAGVPVIGINIPGLKPIEDFHAGVLIDDMHPDTIQKAVFAIESDYKSMVEGCFKAAKHFSFKTSVQPFLSFLLNKE